MNIELEEIYQLAKSSKDKEDFIKLLHDNYNPDFAPNEYSIVYMMKVTSSVGEHNYEFSSEAIRKAIPAHGVISEVEIQRVFNEIETSVKIFIKRERKTISDMSEDLRNSHFGKAYKNVIDSIEEVQCSMEVCIRELKSLNHFKTTE